MSTMNGYRMLGMNHNVNIYRHIKIAKEMELKPGFAIQARKRYLSTELNGIDAECYDLHGWIDGVGDINEFFAILSIDALVKEKAKVKKELKAISKILRPDTGRVTDEMVEAARNYPVENLIDFTRGKAVAFCHEDRHPSLYHATRINKAACPVCDKFYSPIDVLMARDGMDFITAVRQLGG